MVLAGGDRGHGPRVLAALGRGRRPLARARVGDLVRGRQGEHRVELRAPLGGAPAGRGRVGRARRGRLAARADVRRALGRGDAPGGGARPARRARGRPRGDLPPDVPRGAGGVACLRAHRSGPGADLLRLRGARGRAAAAGLRGEGRDHGAGLDAPRTRGADARDRRGGAARGPERGARRRRALGRARRGLARRAAGRRARLRGAVPAHVHVRDDRHAEGRRPRPGRLPRLDRARGLLPGRRRARRPDPLRHRHGLDHGPVDRRRRARDGLDARLRRGRARTGRRTGSGS